MWYATERECMFSDSILPLGGDREEGGVGEYSMESCASWI